MDQNQSPTVPQAPPPDLTKLTLPEKTEMFLQLRKKAEQGARLRPELEALQRLEAEGRADDYERERIAEILAIIDLSPEEIKLGIDLTRDLRRTNTGPASKPSKRTTKKTPLSNDDLYAMMDQDID